MTVIDHEFTQLWMNETPIHFKILAFLQPSVNQIQSLFLYIADARLTCQQLSLSVNSRLKDATPVSSTIFNTMMNVDQPSDRAALLASRITTKYHIPTMVSWNINTEDELMQAWIEKQMLVQLKDVLLVYNSDSHSSSAFHSLSSSSSSSSLAASS